MPGIFLNSNKDILCIAPIGCTLGEFRFGRVGHPIPKSGRTSDSEIGSEIFQDPISSSRSREDVHPISDLGRPRPNIRPPRPDLGCSRLDIGRLRPDIGRPRSDIGSEIFRDVISSSRSWDDVHPTSDLGRPRSDISRIGSSDRI
jgi:hypothetical protein